MSRSIWSAALPQSPSVTILVLAATILVTGCSREPGELEVDKLRAGEHLYVERFIILERARAVALADPVRGASILDSLATAWGDTAAHLAIRALPSDPKRNAQLYRLLARMLASEADSLVFAPYPRRLTEPLPQPRADKP